MKKVFSLVLAVLAFAVIVSLATVLPSFADNELLNIDYLWSVTGDGSQVAPMGNALGVVNFGYATPEASLGNASDDTAAGAVYIWIFGWYMPLNPMSDIGYKVDGGDITYGWYQYDQNLIDVLATFGTGYENYANTLRINAYVPIEATGNHTVEIVAKFADGEERVIFRTFYFTDEIVSVGKPVYSAGNTLVSDNEFWNISMLTDGQCPIFDGANVCPLGWYVFQGFGGVDARAYIDLQGIYQVSGVAIKAMGFNNRAFPNAYTVYGSLDGEHWTEIGGSSGCEVINNFNQVDAYGADLQARYILVKITQINLNPADGVFYGGFGEAEVYGTKIGDASGDPPFLPKASYVTYSNFTPGTAATGDAGGYAAWMGFGTGDPDLWFEFKTDVSFFALELPAFFSYPGTHVTLSFIQDGVTVYETSTATVGDGAFKIDIGTTLPAGRYLCVLRNDDMGLSVEALGGNPPYVVIGYATEGVLFNDEYCAFEKGNYAITLYSQDAGTGFVPYVLKNYVDGTLTDDIGENAAWAGFTTGYTDISFEFNTDVSVNGLIFPKFWSYAGTPVTVTFSQAGTVVKTINLVMQGDAALRIDIPGGLPAGQYTFRMALDSTEIIPDLSAPAYFVAGYATDGLIKDHDYFKFYHGNIAMKLITNESGNGFIPREHITVENPADEFLMTPATCTEAAVYHKSCSLCGDIMPGTFSYGNPTGHDYAFDSFAWNGITSAQAKFVCTHEASHVEYYDATIGSNVKTPATCEAMGTTTYTATYGSYSDSIDLVDIPATGHNYQFDSFVWTGTTAQAKFVCEHDGSHVELYDAAVESNVKAPATCEGKGTTTYTATYGNYSDSIDIEDIDAIGHNYQFDSFVWTGTTAQAKFVCEHDGSHVELYDATVESNVKTPATCEAKGTTTYTATYGNYSDSIDVEDIDALGHNYLFDSFVWNGVTAAQAKFVCEHDGSHVELYDATVASNVKTPATCEAKGIHTYTATYGSYSDSIDLEDIDAIGHNYQFDSFVWTGTTAQAKFVCEHDGSHVELYDAAVESNVKAPATCEAKGTTTYTATYGNYSDSIDVEDIDATGHAYAFDSFVWTGTTAQAKFVCEHDGSHVELYDATVESNVKTPATCEAMGTTTYTATYGNYSDSIDLVDIPATGHNYQFDSFVWNGVTAAQAKFVCEHDGSHVELYDATVGSEVKTPATCEAMGTTTYTATYGSYSDSIDLVDIPATGHNYQFDSFVWTGTTAKAKFVCEHDGSHVELYDAAVESNVKAPATCEGKGTTTYTATYGNYSDSIDVEDIDAIGHNYQFDSFVWTGTTAQAKFVCEHDADHVELYDATVESNVKTPATCEAMGTTTYTATYGNYSDSIDLVDIDALGHNYQVEGFIWTGTTAQAKCVCTRDNVTAYFDAVVTSEVVIAPTCTAKGATTYTATYGTASDTKDVIDIPALGHDYQFDSFVWTDNTAQAKFVCTHDVHHVELYDASVSSNEKTPPTCDEKGVTTYTAVYGQYSDTNDIADVDALGHNYLFDSFVWNGTTAQAKFVCEHDASHVELYDATVGSIVKVQPGCETMGTTTYTATYGNYSDSIDLVDIPATGHNYVFDSFVWNGTTAQAKCICANDQTHVKYFDATMLAAVSAPATCESTGSTVYTAVYGEHSETNAIGNEIPALGHDYQFNSFVWTGETAQAKFVCTHDENHVLYYDATVTSNVIIAPTCTAKGATTYTATYGEFSDIKDVINIPALGHDYQVSEFTWTGTTAQAVLVCSHDASHVISENANVTSEVKISATCEAKGTTTYTATYGTSSDSIDVEDIAATGHAYAFDSFVWTGTTAQAKFVCEHNANHVELYTATVSSNIKTPATCEAKGTTTYTATYGNYSDSIDVEDIAATGHAYAFDSFVWTGTTAKAKFVCEHDAEHVELYDATVASNVKTPATCEAKGTTTYTATYGNYSDSIDVEDIDATGHAYAFDSFVWTGTTAQAKFVCEHNADHVELYDATIASNVKTPATCEAKGTTTYTATYGNYSDSIDVEDIDATGHAYAFDSFVWTGTTAKAKFVCAHDAEHVELYDATIASNVKTPATCEAKGTTTYTATYGNYSDSIDVEDIDATGHAYAFDSFVWTGTTAKAKFVCEHNADHVELYDATIASNVKNPATCEAKGTTTYTATYGNYSDSIDVEDIAATGHAYAFDSFVWTGTTAQAKFVCEHDAEHVELYDATVASNVKNPATCEAKGTTTYTATYGNYSDSIDVEDIAATGHAYAFDSFVWTGTTAQAKFVCTHDADHVKTYNAAVGSNVKTPATCEAKGIHTYTATYGNYSDSIDVDDIDALGHAYAFDSFVWTGTTAKAKFICEHDADHVELYDATVASTVKEQPGCETMGTTTYTATYGSYSDSIDLVDIAATGHDFSIADEKEPTTTETGYRGHKCSHCGQLKIDEVLTLVIIGDADGDGEITDWDDVLLRRYLAGWNVTLNVSAMDVDGDGDVNDWDSMLLIRYLSDWDVDVSPRVYSVPAYTAAPAPSGKSFGLI